MFSKLLYRAAKETLVEYLIKTNLNGCYLLYYMRRRKYQRLVWFSFIVMAVTFAIYVCTTILTSFLKDPIVTTLDPQKNTIHDAPFPAVAVCSHNKFSREAIRNYASNITLRNSNKTLEYWMHRLEMLSGLYNYDSIDVEEAEILHYELENIFGEPFETSKILKLLSPMCDDLIVQCFWDGQKINCKEEFELRMFLDGPCCVFNYQHMKDLDTLYYPNSTVAGRGLAILLNSSTEDYFYAEDSSVGFYVKLFSTQLIPDIRLGDMEEFQVGPVEDVDVQLHLISQVTEEDARVYGFEKRGCYFPYEHKQKTLHQSECLLNCKIKWVGLECECMLFYAKIRENHFNEADELKAECTLLNLGCLASLQYELMDTSPCPDCYPLCSYNNYQHRKTVNRLKHTFSHFRNEIYLNNYLDIPADLSLVKIYYPNELATRYNKNVLFKWYHILPTLGGVISICMGCSIVNGIEIIYFCCYRLLENFLKLRNSVLRKE